MVWKASGGAQTQLSNGINWALKCLGEFCMFAPPAFKLLRAFLNMSDAATLLLFAERVNRQMCVSWKNSWTHSAKCMWKGLLIARLLCFRKAQVLRWGGLGLLSEVLTHSVDGERCEEKKKKNEFLFFSLRNRLRKTSWITFQAQQEVNSLLSRGTQEINRHHQHIPTLAPTHRKEFGHYVAMGDWFTFWPDACWWSKHCGSFLESVQELKCLWGLVCVSITVPAWGSSLLL